MFLLLNHILRIEIQKPDSDVDWFGIVDTVRFKLFLIVFYGFRGRKLKRFILERERKKKKEKKKMLKIFGV